MRKSDALSLVLSASAVLCFCSAAVYDRDSRFSTTGATVQQPCADQKTAHSSAPCLISPGPKNHLCSSELLPDGADREYSAQTNFSQRLAGGILRHFELGLIVVDSTEAPETVEPTALTTDAIITSSVRSKIAGQSQLLPRDFEIQTDDGVVTIRSKEESLDLAAAVINLALCVPDVRQIVYTMPSSVWRTAGAEACRRRGLGSVLEVSLSC
jgi:hypothetical protein